MEHNIWDDVATATRDGSGSGGEGRCTAGDAGCGGVVGMVDPRERHKLAERERRKSMRELFLSLHSLLPHASTVRKEQSAILDEIIKYIPLATARLRSLETRRRSIDAAPMPAADRSNLTSSLSSCSSSSNNSGSDHVYAVTASRRKRARNNIRDGGAVGNNDDGSTGDCDIRVAAEPTSSVSIRVRGDQVNVSFTVSRVLSSKAIHLSAVLDELEANQLDLVRSTHCRDGGKLLHHSESKIREEVDRSTPVLLKASLQELAGRLLGMGRTPAAGKRPLDEFNSIPENT